MKVKTSQLTGPALDWAVAFAVCPEEFKDSFLPNDTLPAWARGWLNRGSPSHDWSQGGPLIERYRVHLETLHEGELWEATVCYRQGVNNYAAQSGPTPLTAAMRAIVAGRLGDEVEIPDELLA